MAVIHEVYGEEIWAQYQGEDSYEIIEHYDGFLNIFPPNHASFTEFDEWPEIKKQAITYAHGNILDITPGAGSSSIYLQNRGLKVTAVQPSQLANKVCRERGLKNSHVLAVDMIDQLGSTKFDTIIMFGSHLGLLNDIYQSKKLFKKLFHIANPGATILIENNHSLVEDNPTLSEITDSNHWIQDIPVQVRIRIRFKKHISEWFNHLMMSETQLQAILEDTGWFVCESIRSESSHYISVLQRHN